MKTKESTYFVYILRTSANTLYIGQTNNLERRMVEHGKKGKKSAKYLKYFSSSKIVYKELCGNRSQALKREAQLKKLTKVQKEILIKNQLAT